MLGWSIMARACRSASKRATTWSLSMPGLMILSATCRRMGSSARPSRRRPCRLRRASRSACTARSACRPLRPPPGSCVPLMVAGRRQDARRGVRRVVARLVGPVSGGGKAGFARKLLPASSYACEQRLHLLPDFWSVGARLVQIGFSLGRRVDLVRMIEDCLGGADGRNHLHRRMSSAGRGLLSLIQRQATIFQSGNEFFKARGSLGTCAPRTDHEIPMLDRTKFVGRAARWAEVDTKPAEGVVAGECLPWPVLARRGIAFSGLTRGGWKKCNFATSRVQSGGGAPRPRRKASGQTEQARRPPGALPGGRRAEPWENGVTRRDSRCP